MYRHITIDMQKQRQDNLLTQQQKRIVTESIHTKQKKIKLTKIQSLPIIGREWEYLFYIDVTYDDYVRFHQSLDAIKPLTRELKNLGEYVAKK